MSTSVDSKVTTDSVRRRACKRVLCATPADPTAQDFGSSASCCDAESCLAGIASRECAVAGSHDRMVEAGRQCPHPLDATSSAEHGIDRRDTASRFCSNHYEKTVNKYGVLLENLGCICKILLSLNLDSCCVLPQHSAASSKSSSSIVKGRLDSDSCNTATFMQQADESKGTKCCTSQSSATTNVVPGFVSQGVEDSSKQICCSVIPFSNPVSGSIVTKSDCSERISRCQGLSTSPAETVLEEHSSSTKHRSDGKRSLCSSSSLSRHIQQSTASTPTAAQNNPVFPMTITNFTFGMISSSSPNCQAKDCCNDSTSHSAVVKSPSDHPFHEPQHIIGATCCSKPSTSATNDIPPTTNIEYSNLMAPLNGRSSEDIVHGSDTSLERCGGRESDGERHEDCRRDLCACGRDQCYHASSSASISTSPQVIDQFSKDECCTGDDMYCDSDTDKSSASHKPPHSHSLPATIKVASLNRLEMDVEDGLPGTQRIALQVQGMDCTGCEKKLSKVLISLPEVSAIKTSLLLAQSEFSLQPSKSINTENIVITLQKMTGFKFTSVISVGVDLDLIVKGRAQGYVDRTWPAKVIDITAVSNYRIRASYHPDVIGARDLLSNPFFKEATLAPPSPPPLVASGRAHLWKSFYMTVFSCICTIPVLVLAWASLPRHKALHGTISLVLATIVQVVVAGPFYVSAAKTLMFSRMVDMDLLVVLSTSSAYTYSVAAYAYLIAGKSLSTGQFFETSTLLITLIMVGRTVAAYARQRAIEAITIETLQTNTAIVLEEDTEEKEIDARLLQYEDLFKVTPDMAVVTDGIILTGESELDESLVTGESTLVHKKPGDKVIAGSINHSGTLKVLVTRLPCENTIKKIGAMVDEAKSSKPMVQELADRVASYFVPAILVLTVAVFLIWVAVGKTVRNQNTATVFITAMTYAISVLIVSCPCAIGLAVPMVVVIAGGVSARHGVIFKTAETIDMARKVSHVIFDKTGTLTQGKLKVTVQEYINAALSYEPSLILALTTNSTHPVSKAIASHLRDTKYKPLAVEHIISYPGKGIEGQWENSLIRAGNPYWLNVQDHPSVNRCLSSGLTVFCVILDSTLVAVYGLRDELRPDALSTVTTLRSRGIEISLLSGDNDSSVQTIASQLGIPPSNVLARCTPAQKQAYVKSQLSPTTSEHPKKNIILFCGDGTNDAPSLAQASIGVHMNCGTDIAGSAADAVIMRSSLHGIITLMDLSRAFHRRVVFNFLWCFVYNLFAVLLAAGAFVSVRGGVRIRPEFAGLGELVSVLPVVAVAVGLKFKRF
ncbi:Cd(2+)-exporting ATPase [Hyphodiscus hymeniophilus]|uniref:Cd(2+)-exporting ATPase n=1 Tax=Hyphodiscus hymeniophilus TaxID=353542 RepID=A0A9P7AW32_9HELO|nr:Cd(2+)-exporting ATPase [Hyphodiscus hymeniophilus]